MPCWPGLFLVYFLSAVWIPSLLNKIPGVLYFQDIQTATIFWIFSHYLQGLFLIAADTILIVLRYKPKTVCLNIIDYSLILCGHTLTSLFKSVRTDFRVNLKWYLEITLQHLSVMTETKPACTGITRTTGLCWHCAIRLWQRVPMQVTLWSPLCRFPQSHVQKHRRKGRWYKGHQRATLALIEPSLYGSNVNLLPADLRGWHLIWAV